jgi:NADH:ubiquinone oxidoreductase subunit F (NADH-binding)
VTTALAHLTRPGAAAPPVGLPRLLAGRRARPGRMSLGDHLEHYGEPLTAPYAVGGRLFTTIERSGLLGRGGAAFPTARKLDAVRRGRSRPVVVVNGMEGEPASAKDRFLLSVAPHLVLDGVALAAAEVRADTVMVAVRRDRADAVHSIVRALAERQRAGLDRIKPTLHQGPPRYVGGEETALVHWLNGGTIRPMTTPPRPFQRGVDGRQTLVLNVETFAHIGLLARYGDAWFRSVGMPDAPGSALMSVTGDVARGGVAEVALGSSLQAIVGACDPRSQPSMVLAGGYFGGWLPWDSCAGLRADPQQLQAAGAGLGAGIVIAAPAGACVVAETARIVAYLARESAGQCGPCAKGVPAVARDLARLCTMDAAPPVTARLRSRIELIDGRGACALPDGVRRLVASVLNGFPDHVAQHERHGGCRDATQMIMSLPPTPRGAADWR